MLHATTPLAQLCDQQAADWQNKFLRYTWAPLDLDEAALGAHERAVIAAESPFLNRQFLPRFPPPQLRRGVRYEKARARWLWHTSWAGMFDSIPGGDEEEPWFGPVTEHRPGADELGYPCRLDTAVRRSKKNIDAPLPEDDLNKLLRHCARGALPSVRSAVAATYDDYELELWWGAHAGATLLDTPRSVEDCLAASLNLANEHEFAGPARLPSKQRCIELVAHGNELPRHALTVVDGDHHGFLPSLR